MPLPANAPIVESLPDLPAPSEGQDLVADYASLGLTLGRHPLSLLRARLKRLRSFTAEELRGAKAQASGIVTAARGRGPHRV